MRIFSRKEKKVSKHWISVNPLHPPPFSTNLYSIINIVSFFPSVLLLVSVKRLWFREVGAGQSTRDKKRSHNRVHTDCLLALLAAYPAACLQLRDKAMKVSDTRGFGCRTWRLSPSCKTSSPDVMSVVCDINKFIQPLLIFYPLRFMLLRLEPSATFTATLPTRAYLPKLG